VPQQDAVAAADPFSSADVDHFVRPEHLTIVHPMMNPEADNAIATVTKPKRAARQKRPMFLRTTSTARETPPRSTTRAPTSHLCRSETAAGREARRLSIRRIATIRLSRHAEATSRGTNARLLKAQGARLGTIATKTGIPKTSLHRYLVDTSATVQS
jgi:hypothetical protein